MSVSQSQCCCTFRGAFLWGSYGYITHKYKSINKLIISLYPPTPPPTRQYPPFLLPVLTIERCSIVYEPLFQWALETQSTSPEQSAHIRRLIQDRPVRTGSSLGEKSSGGGTASKQMALCIIWKFIVFRNRQKNMVWVVLFLGRVGKLCLFYLISFARARSFRRNTYV